MSDIIKIIIKGSSGYCCEEESYTDQVIITPEFIEYKYSPMIETDINPIREWKYKTNSPIFKNKFEKLSKSVALVAELNIDEVCTDIGETEFDITYSDNKKINKIFFVPRVSFADFFKIVKSMVPGCEYVPAVLLTEEDYEKNI